LIKYIFTIIGIFLGAGFASGKEVFNFFSLYGKNSFLEIILVCFLFFATIYKTLKTKEGEKLKTYEEFLTFLEKKHKLFNSKIYLRLVNVFLITSFYIMINALCLLFFEKINISKYIVVIFTIIICYFIFIKNDIKIIFNLNIILIPLIIIIFLIIGIKNISFKTNIIQDEKILVPILKCLLYFSYNILLIIPILFKININKKNFLKTAIGVAISIFILLNILNLILISNFNLIKNEELPILYLLKTKGTFFSFIYFYMFFSAVVTTLISSGFAFCNNIKKRKKIKISIFLICSIFFVSISFSQLINVFYSILGSIGLIEIVLIFF